MRGDVAAPLIYSATILDFLSIDRGQYDIVAVAGNSMGWYSALACGGAVSVEDGFRISNAMGLNSQTHGPGGQILLQVVDEDWRPVPGLRERLFGLVADIGSRPGHALALSIDLAGMLVFAGNEEGLTALLADAPPTPGRDPLRLAGHGPFHTPLMFGSSGKAMAELPHSLFHRPALPLVDGRGHIWRRHASEPAAVRDYTFRHQILAPYDFALSVQVAVREYAPDVIILPGPGDTLGGAIAQSLIGIGWQGIGSKADFVARQAADPVLLSMGRAEQRGLVTGNQ
jgi:malonyl CoA-acyl carrier protein transacylase